MGSFLAIRWTRKRLATLSKAIEVVSEGNYSYILDPGAKDEIGDLIHVFNIMIGRVRSSQDKLKLLNQELRETHLSTVKAFVETIEAKDAYTRGHSENVAMYSMLLGRELGLSEEELEEIHIAALLHDIGKIGIREEVLRKKSSLSDNEYEHIKSHPIISSQIVSNIPNLAPIACIIRHHHESFNGKGYPGGLAGNEIPLGARILAIADAFDAMTSNRQYRDACSREEALSELSHCSGIQFDPELVEAFIRAITCDEETCGRGDDLSIA